MKKLSYTLEEVGGLSTSRAGLVTVVEPMNKLDRTEHVDRCFPPPLSNRGFQPSVFVN